MNRGNIVTYVGEKVGLTYDTDNIERTMLRNWVNEAVVDVLLRTHIYIQIGDAALSSGVSEYRMDTSVLAIDDGRGSTPAGIGHYRVISLDEMISRQSADPVSDSAHKYIAIEADLMLVHPTPASSETLRFFYVPKPTEMSNDSNDPSSSTYGGIPTQYHKALEYYVLWQAAEYDDKDRALKPMELRAVYLEYINDIRANRRRQRDRRSPRGRIGYPDRRPPVSPSNSQYPR